MTSILSSNSLKIKSEIDEVPAITEKICWFDTQNIKHEEEVDFEISNEEFDNISPSKRQSSSRRSFYNIYNDNLDDDISIKSYGDYSSEDCQNTQAKTEISDEKYLSGIDYLRLITVKERKPINGKSRRGKVMPNNKSNNDEIEKRKNFKNKRKITSKKDTNSKINKNTKVQNNSNEIKKKNDKTLIKSKKNYKTLNGLKILDKNDSTTSNKLKLISNESTTKTIKTFRRILPIFNSKINETKDKIEISKGVKRKRENDEKIVQDNKKEFKNSKKPKNEKKIASMSKNFEVKKIQSKNNQKPDKKLSKLKNNQQGKSNKISKTKLNESSENEQNQNQIKPENGQKTHLKVNSEKIKIISSPDGASKKPNKFLKKDLHSSLSNTKSSTAPSEIKLKQKSSKSENIPKNSKTSKKLSSPKKSKITKFQCKICSKSCASQAYLTRHSKMHKPQISFKCDQCGMEFKIKGCFLKHVCNICKICDRKFAKKEHLMLHMRAKHVDPSEIELFSCDLCGKSFKHKTNIKTHMTSNHLKIMEVSCKVC